MLFSKIKKFFSKKGGDLIIFIISLLLAFFMWSIQKLSQEYTTLLKYNVSINTSLPGRAQTSNAMDVVLIRGRASGFYILKHIYATPEEVSIKLNADTKQLVKLKGREDIFFIRSNDIKNIIQEELGVDIKLENIATDTLFFYLPKQVYKKVPIIANTFISYKEQYMSFNTISLKPDSVLIYGDSHVIKGVDSIYTDIIKASKIESNINGVIALKQVAGVEMSVKDIYYSLEVNRYVEETINIRVNVINVPHDKNVIVLPKEIKIKFRMKQDVGKPYSSSDFYAVADYKNIINSVNNNIIKIVLYKKPKNITDIRIEPPFVELIEEK